MFNRHVVEYLSAYCHGELETEQSRRVAEHLLKCERCRKEYDEIKLGVQLAEQLPQVSAPASMWAEIEALLEEQSTRPAFQPRRSRFIFISNWYRFAAVSALLVAAIIIGVIWRSHHRTEPSYGPDSSWIFTRTVPGSNKEQSGRLAAGQSLETDDVSRAKIENVDIGNVEIDSNTRIRLIKAQETEQRLALDRGTMHATISAPPRLFFVDTPSAEAIDQGCAYTLKVDDAGRGLLHVTLGWVELVGEGRKIVVPRYGMCETWPGIGPGTPYFEDASESLRSALEKFDFENGGDEALKIVMDESRPRDTFTLWHLLSRVDKTRRGRILDRMVALVGLPKGITREGTIRLDQNMLDLWADAMDTIWF